MDFTLYIVIIENIIIFILVMILVFRMDILNKKLQGMSFSQRVSEKEIEEWRIKLLEKVKEKINITEQAQDKLTRGEDLVAQFIYRHNDIKQLSDELNAIFKQPLQTLKDKYPDLTELDLLVISLIGIGMDNDEICTLLRMEKRTLYRRRQLIAQRIGMSSTQLDMFAMTILTEM
ncbi:MAG: hypothetical protein IJQ95_04040 [Paludibacteraceae bacterium]|nr:hypothetical protein [Paludibacteraceae bacterium]